ncbi:N-6 DNA methylase [Streptomyces sp. NPDC047017]|uniref:N-6 DNA methylase n=1 Tax=Streptomyces sp. NPDC047017 TaxID=3155024 RepID=UPI0033FB32EF
MDQLDLFGELAVPDEPPTPPAPEPPQRRNVIDLPPPPTPVTLAPRRAPAAQGPDPKLKVIKPTVGHYRPRQADPDATAFKIAEAVSYAWNQAHAGADIAVPVGVVAALALWPLRGPDAYLAADWWLGLNDADLLTAFRECWARWWILRPDLIDRATPLHKWLDDEDPHPNRAAAVRAVVTAALTRGLLHLTSNGDPYFNSTTDVIGPLFTQMRSAGARDSLAEVYTPSSVAEMLARIVLDGPLEPGMKWHDPAGGTGTMYRATAQVLRERGLDPHDFGWSLNDIDELAAAGAAVNAILWDLGPHVLIACGDTLAEGDLIQRAVREARGSLERRDKLHQEAAIIAALQKVEALVFGKAA